MINVLTFTNYSFVLICNLLTCFQKCVFVKVGPPTLPSEGEGQTA